MNSSTILIIEDEVRIAHWLRVYFERAGYMTTIAADGITGLDQARTLTPDLIVLDLMLPRLNGIDLCQTLREESDVPIIMLTAKGELTDRLHGLDVGADDYIVKPFDPQEVIARARAVLRRSQGKIKGVLTLDRLAIDEDTRTVTLDGTPIHLSQAQYDLLSAFVRHPNQILSRDQLIRLAFQDQFEGFDRAIDSQIKRLRKLIHIDGYEPIQTVYGAGYKFVTQGARCL